MSARIGDWLIEAAFHGTRHWPFPIAVFIIFFDG
jgi:hypothetical protein